MKPVIILYMALCVLPLEAEMNKAIYFHHIGAQYEPFRVIVITTERDETGFDKNGDLPYKYCKVAGDVFDEIKTFIQETKLVTRNLREDLRDYGSFEVVIEEGGKISYYIPGSYLSLVFFYELIKRVSEKGLDWLAEELDAAYFRRLIYIY
jgi:hypothetical protein